MNEKRWSAVDEYLVAMLVKPDAVLEKALAESDRGGLPGINVSACQGKLLNLMARMVGARRISRSGRWAAIRQSGSPAPCRRPVA